GGEQLAFHARGHALSGLEHYELAIRLSVYPSTRLFVNDRLDVALAAGAAGVQLAGGSLDPEHARRLDPKWWIGTSVHDLREAEAAQAAGADYLLVGPVFPTATHPSPARAPLGPRLAVDPRAVVVGHNRSIVRRPALGDVRIGAGDAVELVHFVGGG